MKDLFLSLFLAVLLTNTGHAQDPVFSQFYANPIYLNPALAGANVCPRFIVNYRNQWPKIPETFVTVNASYDQYVERFHGSIGVIATGDKAGVYRTFDAGLIYAYRMQLAQDFFVSAAVQMSYYNINADFSSLTLPDQFSNQGITSNTSIDQAVLDHALNENYTDFSAGIVAYSKDFYGGFSVAHIAEPSTSLQMKFTAHAGLVIDLKQKKSNYRTKEMPTVSPNILYQQQNNSQFFYGGFYVNTYPMVFGIWTRYAMNNFDAFTFLVGLQQERFKVGYSYDLTISKLTPNTGGAHEISLAFSFFCPDKKYKMKMINCPKF